ncbi:MULTISPECIES: pyridoxamine 5'-phosphate oxidase family protein [Tenacibaculum]|uniref:pyridoxamine 5'-phosphate oxidase family protein n=1 Tax=Tenacibaculum TaxID=104267 RepID=UPI001F0A9877|nr:MULTISPECIES: pyridoxamine 5'-phosphate oxidase family protein [Tenacibaculum]MCH3881395.1 pyridoxamine 5'-phosphate oxidase family protein [Tenacibaculum aquimarinum]MDO6599011.1 pyridoxamine 5'-phosphate oxidase family protein [Tenacibaculum sp. 1_MG-2023]
MAKFTNKITKRIQAFIEAQKLFFVATAPKDGRINLSPKGMDSFRVLDEKTVAWLSVTGSGNETSAHLLENGKMTIMMCAFEGAPNILRLYGTAIEVLPKDENWTDLAVNFPEIPGTRQIFVMTIDSTQSSCGMSIPFYEYKGERNELNDWAASKTEEELQTYIQEKNSESIDGLETKK